MCKVGICVRVSGIGREVQKGVHARLPCRFSSYRVVRTNHDILSVEFFRAAVKS